MESEKSSESVALVKLLILVVFFVALINHLLRAFGDSGFLVLRSLNEARRALGLSLMSAGQLCPGSARGICNGITRGVSVVLGLH